MRKPDDILEEEKVSTRKQGRWSADEHSRYIKGVVFFGYNWKKVSAYVETRTPLQVRMRAKRLESAKKKERHKKEERIIYDYLTQKERRLKEQLPALPRRVRKVIVEEKLANLLRTLFGSATNRSLVMTKESLKLFGFNDMKQRLSLSSIESIASIKMPSSTVDQSNSMEIDDMDKEQVIPEQTEYVVNNAIEYNVPVFTAFASLHL